VVSTNVRGDEEFVRVYSKYDDKGQKVKPSGHWIMNKSDIEGLNAVEMQQKYALPGVPTHMVDVDPALGTNVNVGGASGNTYGAGGGRQWYIERDSLPDKKLPEEWFSNSQKIGK
jgi:filamentous hemagglutinin